MYLCKLLLQVSPLFRTDGRTHNVAGAQLGIFEGRGPVHEMGALNVFKDDMASGLASTLSLRGVRCFCVSEADFPQRKIHPYYDNKS